jgi:bifunctional non-homologous end joining protein LigD
VSHAERVIDSSTGWTKGDLVAYYRAIAHVLIGQLKARPVSLVRAPQGIGKPLFFQRHADSLHARGLVELDPSILAGHPALIALNTAAGIEDLSVLNVVEFHTWNARIDAIDRPDRLVFDLDPGAGIAFASMREATELMIGFLEELNLPSFIKTSGGKGMHVVVPIQRRYTWDWAHAFAQAVVARAVRAHPQRFVMKTGPRNRVGKIFIDFLRNTRGATTVAAYSARARAGLGVSMPIAREELRRLASGDYWTIKSAPVRLKGLKSDPWEGYSRSAARLEDAARELELPLARQSSS